MPVTTSPFFGGSAQPLEHVSLVPPTFDGPSLSRLQRTKAAAAQNVLVGAIFERKDRAEFGSGSEAADTVGYNTTFRCRGLPKEGLPIEKGFRFNLLYYGASAIEDTVGTE